MARTDQCKISAVHTIDKGAEDNVLQKRIFFKRQAYNLDATEKNKAKSFIFKIELPASTRTLIPDKR